MRNSGPIQFFAVPSQWYSISILFRWAVGTCITMNGLHHDNVRQKVNNCFYTTTVNCYRFSNCTENNTFYRSCHPTRLPCCFPTPSSLRHQVWRTTAKLFFFHRDIKREAVRQWSAWLLRTAWTFWLPPMLWSKHSYLTGILPLQVTWDMSLATSPTTMIFGIWKKVSSVCSAEHVRNERRYTSLTKPSLHQVYHWVEV